jgi:hypothetical protein
MTSRVPGTRRGAHRGHRNVAAAIVPSLLAVLAVTALVTALFVWRGEDADPQRAESDHTSAALTSESPSATQTAKPASGPATTSSSPKAKPKPKPKPETTVRSAGKVRDVQVVVLNQSSRNGLAARAAARLRSKGWSVPSIGNFRGQVGATTVYYPEGAREQARAAAADLPTPPRVRPRFGNLSLTRLTVVVTDDYPS